MKKRLLLTSSVLLLSANILPIVPTVIPLNIEVSAQSEATIDDIYQVMTQQGPITDEQWNQIPAEDWLRYANEAGPTMYMDNVFYKAYNEHRTVFHPKLNQIYTMMEQNFKVDANQFNVYVGNEYNALNVLMLEKYSDGSGQDFAALAQKIGVRNEAQWNQGVQPLSREEAVQRVNANDEAGAMKRNVQKYSNLPAEKFNQITDEMFFEAAVVHAMKNPLGGDYGTQLAVFKSLYPNLYTTSEIGVRPLTREEAINRVNTNHEARAMKVNVQKYSNLPIETFNQITDEMFFEAAVIHAMKNPLGGDYGTQLAVFKSLYPDFYKQTNDNTHTTTKTREEAVELINRSNLDKKIPDFLSTTVKKEIIDKIPTEAFYEGAVHYLMTHTNTNDFSQIAKFFMNIYPEYFTDNTTVDDTKRQQQLEKIQQHQEKLTTTFTNQNVNARTLKENQTFNFEEGEFKITNVYLLAPGEAGNQTDHHLLGIHFIFTNKTTEDIVAPQIILENHSMVGQFDHNQLMKLNNGFYHIPSEASDLNQTNAYDEHSLIVKPNETLAGTLYYDVPNVDNDLIWSVIEHDDVHSYQLNIQDLQKFPYQSASYVSNGETPTGYLFDFERLYFVLPHSADTTPWENKNGITVNANKETLSPEAKNHYRHLVETLGDDIQLVQFENIHYTLAGETIQVTIGDNKEVILTLSTQTKWQSFSDDTHNVYELMAIR